MNALDTLLLEQRLRHRRTAARAAVLLLVAFLAWSLVAQLEEVAVATGEVVPQGRVKVIQHLEGGIIEGLHVAEGDTVEPGDTLVQLNLAALGLNHNELAVELDGLRLQRARLLAEAQDAPLALPDDIVSARTKLADQERRAHAARQSELESLLSMLAEQVRQREADLAELRARRRTAGDELKIAQEKLVIAEDLVSEGLMSRMEYLQLKRDIARLRGERAALKPTIPRAEAALAEAREHEREQRLKFRRAAEEELSNVEVTIARTRERLDQAVDQHVRAEIRSPIHGTVKNMRYHTIGGVVRPGDPIMEIVPSDGALLIEARLSPLDRGYVREDQSARVRISSYDFVRYGSLNGSVSHVATDSDTDRNGNPYFRVVVRTDRSFLGTEEQPLPITSGMQAAVDIQTGKKSVLEYMIRPVLKLRHDAFKER